MSLNRYITTLFPLLTLCLLVDGCGSSGPAAIQPGTPAFFWSTARQAYQAGDYVRAADNLSKLTQAEGEYKNKAQVSLIMISTGMVQGYMDFADAYDLGAKANKESALAFRRQASAARSQAKSVMLQSLEAFHTFNLKVKDPSVVFEFGYPNGSLGEIGTLTKVAKGMLPPASEAESTQQKAVQKGVVWSACRVVGADDDSAKAVEIFKTSPTQVPREKFLLGMAASMVDHSELFGPKQLDEPLRIKMMLAEASEALKQVPESKETKALDEKIAKILKSMKTT